MELIWQGKDITPYAKITGCIHREASHGESDLLEIRMLSAETWHRWKPETDETVRVKHGEYDTGTLYLHSLIPEGSEYRLLASSVRSGTGQKSWYGYRRKTFREIFMAEAEKCGMRYGLYGTEGLYRYEWMEKRDESGPAFLDRICRAEGIALKTFGGGFRGIDIRWAQNRNACARITVKAGQDGARWERHEGEKWSRLTLIGPEAQGSARDHDAEGFPEHVICGMGFRDAATAQRWARGLLLDHNRECETLEIEMKMNAGLRAMERIDVEGNTAANGAWIIDEAEHDLTGGKSNIRLVRALGGIG